MKNMPLARWAVIALTALLAWSCSDPVSNSGTGQTTNADTAKVNFESGDMITAGDVYNPGTALTKVDTAAKASLETTIVAAGSASLKVSGTLQEDKYGTAKEIGIRIKAPKLATGTTGATADMLNKVITLKAYVPTGSKATGLQFVLGGGNDAISSAVTLTPGQWNTLYFKADSGYTVGGNTSLNHIDSTGTVLAAGAYTSPSLNLASVSEFAVRILSAGSDTAALDDPVTFYIDGLTWSDTAAETKVAAPTSNLAEGTSTTYKGAQSVTLSTTTTGASVYYTLSTNGTDPADPTSASTAATSAITLAEPASGTTTYIIKALATKTGVASSSIAKFTYLVAPATVFAGVDFDTMAADTALGKLGWASGTFKVVTIASVSGLAATGSGETTNVASALAGGWNTGLKVAVSLPTGKTLADYTNITVKAYFPVTTLGAAGSSGSGGSNYYKAVKLRVGTGLTGNVDDSGADQLQTDQTSAGGDAWTTFTYAIPAGVKTAVGSATTFDLAVGTNNNGATIPYYIGKIALE